MMESGVMTITLLVILLAILESSLQVAAQSLSVANLTHSSATLVWDITIEGARIQSFEISVNCQGCIAFVVSGNETSYELTGLRDNTPFRACVTPFTSQGMGMGMECIGFRTLLSPRTLGALCVGLFLVVSFFVLLAMDLLCRRHQIEVEDAKRDELLQQGWQTFKRSSTWRVAKKASRASAPSIVQPLDDDGFEHIGDITIEEDLLE